METAVTVMEHGSGALVPAMDLGVARKRYQDLLDFTKSIMKDGVDYGTIPGTPKPTLLKPGAEKLASFFGLSQSFTLESSVEDWTGADHGGEPLFYYRYKCRLIRNGVAWGEGEGSANSWETKHRFRWVKADEVPAHLDSGKLKRKPGSLFEFEFAIRKRETSGRYGKPAEYWDAFEAAIKDGTARKVSREARGEPRPGYEIEATLYRVPNADVFDLINTLQKMSAKRALIAAALIACNASEYFTQDLEDLEFGSVTPDAPAPPDAPDPGNRREAAPKSTTRREAAPAPASTAAAVDGDRLGSMRAELDKVARKIAAIGPEAAEALDEWLSGQGAAGSDVPFGWVATIDAGKDLYKRMNAFGAKALRASQESKPPAVDTTAERVQ